MPGPPEQSLSREILDFFEESKDDPCTADEIAGETGYPLEKIRNELDGLVDRGLLQTKEIDGSKRVWWLNRHEQTADEWPESLSGLTDASDAQDSRVSRQRLLEQHRRLAQFVTRINITDDLDKILRQVTVEARELVGAHQSVTSRTVDQNWAQAINEVSLSEKYAEYRDYETEPDGSGIYSVVCKRNEPIRLTQAELESHPAWKAFGDEADEHPPMDGWLAVPIIGPENENRGLIQLSDKYQGEFTGADEAILVQLANVASAAIENARLYDDLRESEERYRTLVENFPGGAVTLYDEDLRYIAAGGENVTGVGRSVDDLVGSQLHDILPDELAAQIAPHYRAAIEEGERQSFEASYDGTHYLFRAVPVRDEAGDVYAGMGISQDITDRQEYQRQLEESNDRLQQFAYAASHDLQEPLRMVSSYLQLLENRYADELDEDAQEYIDFAVDGADRMREMVADLLAFSRVEQVDGEFEPVDTDGLLSEVTDDLQIQIRENGAEIVAESLPTVVGDREQLKQVFSNLISNGIKYNESDPPRVEITAERRSDRVRVSVSDNGIGIDPDQTDRIFQVFKRLHHDDEYTGTGIGLSLCQQIVNNHGGTISVESEPGDGSTFSFTLPAPEP